MRLTLTPHGRAPVTVTPALGWRRLDTDIGVQVYRDDTAQLRCARGGWYALSITFENGRVWSGEGYLPPRAILPVRPDSPAPTHGLLRLVGDPSDFSGGGGAGIDAGGASGTVHDHDAAIQRTPVGLFDMATGKLRDARSIPVEGYYAMSRGYPFNKVGIPPDYSRKWDPSNQYDDRRDAADATSIPGAGGALRSTVLSWQAFDDQHFIRAFRFAILLQHDAIVRDDMRALARDAELAWSPEKEAKILASPGGIGHADVGRGWAWCAYILALVDRMDGRIVRAARDLFGVGPAARMRRIARHVQHSRTGILQRFVEGMSGSPVPHGPKPASGVPQGQGIALTQHLEACAQITSLDALGMKRESTKLARTILSVGGLKWFNTDTGKPEGGGWHGPASDQVWPAVAVWLRNDRERALASILDHRVPTNGGASFKYATLTSLHAAHLAWSDRGKNRWIIDELTKVLSGRRAA